MAETLNTPFLPESRVDLENLIEAAIARLDAMDGDADLEDSADFEPSLAAREQWTGNQMSWSYGVDDEREADDLLPIAPRRARNGTHSPALRLIDGGLCK